MISLNRRRVEPQRVDIMRRIAVMLGCLVFLFSSFVFPFYLIRFAWGSSTSYWSFRSEFYPSALTVIGIHGRQTWFSAYWFEMFQVQVGFDKPEILIPMFAIQVLASLFSLVCILFMERALSLIPVLTSAAVIGLMIYTNNQMFGSGEYQLGYYLVYLSLGFFVTAFALAEWAKRRQNLTTEQANLPNGDAR